MKTSFQRKINYSKVFHCGRAEDFHRRCCCCSCCIFVVLVVEHFRILFVLPAILIFHLSESGSTFYIFFIFLFLLHCRPGISVAGNSGRATPPFNPFRPLPGVLVLFAGRFQVRKTLGWDSFTDFLTSLVLGGYRALFSAGCQFDRNGLQFGATVLLSSFAEGPVLLSPL